MMLNPVLKTECSHVEFVEFYTKSKYVSMTNLWAAMRQLVQKISSLPLSLKLCAHIINLLMIKISVYKENLTHKCWCTGAWGCKFLPFYLWYLFIFMPLLIMMDGLTNRKSDMWIHWEDTLPKTVIDLWSNHWISYLVGKERISSAWSEFIIPLESSSSTTPLPGSKSCSKPFLCD